MTVDLTFFGAAREVTGSCIMVRTGKSRFLVDCGMFQGGTEGDRKNARKFPVDPSTIDFVLCTHAHIDHSGLLPKLVKDGFRGGIHCTDATADLLKIMLPDSGYIQERDSEWKSRKRQRKGKKVVAPLYTEAEAQVVAGHLRPVPYGTQVEPRPGITVNFLNSGHILGSSIITVDVADSGPSRRLVFSGDFGHRGLPILHDPEQVNRADVLVIESTYGNRVHKGIMESIDEFTHAINDTLIRKEGNVIIPVFAVGRTQDVLYALIDLTRKGRLKGITVYLDSPLAIEASRIVLRNDQYFNEEAKDLLEWRRANPDALKIVLVNEASESMKLNNIKGGAIIMAGSGMCNAGRIKHHLKHNLWRKECSIIIVGFQAQGTPGRKIVDGAKWVKVFGEDVMVAADVYTIGGLSAHGDREDLLKWAASFHKEPGKVLVNHGEESVSLEFAETLRSRLGWNPQVPYPEDPIPV